MYNSPFGIQIENVARRTDIHLLNGMEKARIFVEILQCVDFRVFYC